MEAIRLATALRQTRCMEQGVDAEVVQQVYRQLRQSSLCLQSSRRHPLFSVTRHPLFSPPEHYLSQPVYRNTLFSSSSPSSRHYLLVAVYYLFSSAHHLTLSSPSLVISHIFFSSSHSSKIARYVDRPADGLRVCLLGVANLP